MKATVLFLSLSALLPGGFADDAKPHAGLLPASCEVVMSPGMRITATTSEGTIAITAVDELTRSYIWDGATRSIEMSPQKSRFFGSLGLFHEVGGEHWRDHHGITRCFTDEGQQHFKTVEEALKWIDWIKKRNWWPIVYRDDGLVVGSDKNLGGKKLGVEVWQILIDGKKPKRLPGSQNDKIVVDTVETETVPLVKAVANDDLKTVTALLAQGADASVKNSVEVPVLVMAVRHGTSPVVEALLKNRADANVRDVDTDLPPVWDAVCRDTPDRAIIIKMLLDAGADVNAASRMDNDPLRGYTLLMAAAEEGNEGLVQLLLDKGADVNARTGMGETALSMAKRSRPPVNRAVIRTLEAAAKK